MSTLLNVTITSSRKITLNIEENYDPTNNEEEIKSNIDIPPQGILEILNQQYRLITVVKNMEDKNLNRNQLFK